MRFLKEKRGSVLIMTMVILVISILLTALIVNMGTVYAYRSHVQRVSDAASLGGAAIGMKAYHSAYDGRPLAIIDPKLAEPMARRIIQQNGSHLSDSVTIEKVALNPKSWRDQYFGGGDHGSELAVEINAKVRTMMLDRINLPFFRFKVESVTKVKPR